MMGFGESMMNWLRKVDLDQNVQGLTAVEKTIQTETGRKWFKRQDLTPTLKTGAYNPVTEKFVLGGEEALGDPAIEVLAVSAAASTFTVPAGQRWKILDLVLKNSTRAHTWSVDVTTGGVTSQIKDDAAGAATAGQTAHAINAGADSRAAGGPYWVNAAGTIVCTNLNFVAADVIEVSIHYRIYGAI